MCDSDNISIVDLNSVCRTCLSKDDEVYDVNWLSTSGCIQWMDGVKLEDLLHKLVIEDQSDMELNLPTKICLQCTQQFYNIHIFVEDCKKSQIILRNILNQYQNNFLQNNTESNCELGLQIENNIDKLIESNADFTDLDIRQDIEGIENLEENDSDIVANPDVDHNDNDDFDEEVDVVDDNSDKQNFKESSDHIYWNRNSASQQDDSRENDHSQSNVQRKNSSESNKNNELQVYLDVRDENVKLQDNVAINEDVESHSDIYESVSMTEYKNMTGIKDFKGNVIIYERPESKLESEFPDIESSLAESEIDIEEPNVQLKTEQLDPVNEFPEIDGFGYMCSTCDSPFINFSDLMKHKRLLGHNLEQIFVCPECEKKFFSYMIFYEHFQSHMYDIDDEDEGDEDENDENCGLVDMELKLKYKKPYTCKICNLGLATKEKLSFHTEKCHSSVTCEHCEVTMPKVNFEEHALTCKTEKDDPSTFSCKKCSARFDNEKLLYDHVNKAHSTRPFIECGVCALPCMGKQHLESHMQKFHRGKKCPKCDKLFQDSQALADHLKTIHTDEQKSICEYCGKKFTWRNSLLSHVRMHHTGTSKTYDCNLCGKTFLNKRLHSFHVFRHKGLKPFTCQYCDRSFNNQDNLITHSKTHREKGGVHRCLQCGKNYYMLENFERHLVREHGFDASLSLG